MINRSKINSERPKPIQSGIKMCFDYTLARVDGRQAGSSSEVGVVTAGECKPDDRCRTIPRGADLISTLPFQYGFVGHEAGARGDSNLCLPVEAPVSDGSLSASSRVVVHSARRWSRTLTPVAARPTLACASGTSIRFAAATNSYFCAYAGLFFVCRSTGAMQPLDLLYDPISS